jgi:addiction module RelE/StbE family toxin
MIKVSYTTSFQRAYKKAFKNQPQRQELFLEKVSLFITDPFHPQLKTHKLKGALKDFYSFSIEFDLRIIFSFLSENEVAFEDIGTHDEVY